MNRRSVCVSGLVLAAGIVGFPWLALGSDAMPEPFEEDGVRFTRVAHAPFRWKGWLAVYDVDMAVGPGTTREKPLEGGPVRLEFTYHRAFTAKEIVDGGNALLAKNVPADELDALKPRLERLNRAYGDVRPGDRYTLTHAPGKGLTLRLNGKALATVEGDDFAGRYLRIWLGSEPIHKGLRDRLLGAAR
jgi:hypothetical protein